MRHRQSGSQDSRLGRELEQQEQVEWKHADRPAEEACSSELDAEAEDVNGA